MLCKVWHFLKTLNTHLPCNLAILLLGADPGEKHTCEDLYPNGIAALSATSKTGKPNWISQLLHINKMKYSSGLKGDELLMTWINLKVIRLSQRSQVKKRVHIE